MSISTPGMIGACAGLLLALGIYVALSFSWQRSMNAVDVTVEQRERLASMWPVVRTVLIVDFLILAALGYFAGETIGS